MLSRRSWLTTLLALFGIRKAKPILDVVNEGINPSFDGVVSAVDWAKAGSEHTVIYFYDKSGMWEIIGTQYGESVKSFTPYPYWHGQLPFRYD